MEFPIDPKKSTVQHVRDFHLHFQVPYIDDPMIPPANRCELRMKLLREELKELSDAIDAENIVEVFDALLDLQYVLDGTFLEFGLAGFKDAGFREVHRSNMSKLDENGKPIFREDGKILKGPKFFAPYLKAVLNGDIT